MPDRQDLLAGIVLGPVGEVKLFLTGGDNWLGEHFTMTGSVNRRRFMHMLGLGGASALAMPYVSSKTRAQSKVLYVNSYGGNLEQAWTKAFFDPFTAATGIEVKPVAPVSFAKLKAQVQSGAYDWDVTIANNIEIFQAAADGLDDQIRPDIVDIAALPEGMVNGNAVGAYTLGTVLTYRTDKFPDKAPSSWADFWNVGEFPGNRCLFDRPFTSLAYAALAAGASTDGLYPMDFDAAFAKMDEIKPHIKVWWKQGAQSQQLIRDGEVDMIAMWSARAADLIMQDVPIRMVWNQGENFSASWLVAKNTPRSELAWQYVNFVAQPEQQAALTKLVPYGPVNSNAVSLVQPELMAMTPSAPENKSLCFEHDAEWLVPRLSELRDRWTQWIVS